MKFQFRIINGASQMTKAQRAELDAEMLKMSKDMGDSGVMVELSIKKTGKRSNKQNAYLWGCVMPLVRQGMIDTGNQCTLEECHEFLKWQFNSTEICNNEGEVIGKRAGSTTEMNKTEFMSYLARIQEWSATYLNVVIPDPEQQQFLNFE